MAVTSKSLKLHWRAFLTVANAGNSIWCFWHGFYAWGLATALVAVGLLITIFIAEKTS